MRLEQRMRSADRRPHAEAGDAVMPDQPAMRRVLQPDAYGIDAERRMEIIVEFEVGCRIAQGPAEPLAGDHAPLDLEGPAEQRRRMARLAGGQVVAEDRKSKRLNSSH